jgi:hypothetical protein
MDINWTVVISGASLAFLVLSTIVGVVWKALSRLSDKVFQIEIWARDEFVRKSSFDLVTSRIEKSIEKIGDRIEVKFDELTKRIDTRH